MNRQRVALEIVAVKKPTKPGPFTEKDRQRLHELAKTPTSPEDFDTRSKEIQPIMLRLITAHREGLDLEELVKYGQGALAYWKQGEKSIACKRFDKFRELLVLHSDKWKSAQE